MCNFVARKVSFMDDISQKCDGPHEQLMREYEELMTSPDGIYGYLEKMYKYPDSVLGNLFMVCKFYIF